MAIHTTSSKIPEYHGMQRMLKIFNEISISLRDIAGDFQSFLMDFNSYRRDMQEILDKIRFEMK